MWSTRQENTGRRNTELNACVIYASYDVPSYINMQNEIQIYAYRYYFNY